MSEIKIIKLIAPKTISINGHPAPCECTENITCVQASSFGFDKKLKRYYMPRKI